MPRVVRCRASGHHADMIVVVAAALVLVGLHFTEPFAAASVPPRVQARPSHYEYLDPTPCRKITCKPGSTLLGADYRGCGGGCFCEKRSKILKKTLNRGAKQIRREKMRECRKLPKWERKACKKAAKETFKESKMDNQFETGCQDISLLTQEDVPADDVGQEIFTQEQIEEKPKHEATPGNSPNVRLEGTPKDKPETKPEAKPGEANKQKTNLAIPAVCSAAILVIGVLYFVRSVRRKKGLGINDGTNGANGAYGQTVQTV